MTLGQRVKEYRLAHDLTQAEFCEQYLMNTTKQTLHRWETDQKLPTLANVILLSEALGVTVDYLLYGSRYDEDELASARKGVKNAMVLTEVAMGQLIHEPKKLKFYQLEKKKLNRAMTILEGLV